MGSIPITRSIERERQEIVVSILMHQPERVVVLPVEVEQPRGAVVIAVSNVQSLGQGDPARENGVDVDGHALAGVEVKRDPASDASIRDASSRNAATYSCCVYGSGRMA